MEETQWKGVKYREVGTSRLTYRKSLIRGGTLENIVEANARDPNGVEIPNGLDPDGFGKPHRR